MTENDGGEQEVLINLSFNQNKRENNGTIHRGSTRENKVNQLRS